MVILKQEYRPADEIRAQLLAEMEAHAETRNEVERMRDIVTVNYRRLAAVWDEARAEVDRLREAVRQVHALAEKSRADWPRHTAWGALVDIHKIAKGMVES